MKKQYWYAITCETDTPEEIVGFRQALIFRRKQDAEEKFYLSGYSFQLKKENGKVWRYRIRRVLV